MNKAVKNLLSAPVIAVKSFTDNYIWLITVGNDEVVIVDPGDAQPVIDTLEKQNLRPIAILITHHHHDHIEGIESLKKQYDLDVYGPATENIPHRDQGLSGGDQLLLGSSPYPFEVLDTPGHTAGHISYLHQGRLFCGDTLFCGGCGRLLGGTIEQLFRSLNLIAQLPDETKIYCTHEYTLANLTFAREAEPDNPALLARLSETTQLRETGQITVPSTLSIEKSTNPFLRCDRPSVTRAVEQLSGQTLPNPLAVFTALRQWKDRF